MDSTSLEETALPVAHDTDSREIRYVPFEKKYALGVFLLTAVEFPFPENVLCCIGALFYCLFFGVVALDENGKVVGYFLGQPPINIGISRKKVGILTVVCVSSKHQKKGIAKNLGKYVMEGKSEKFSPDDFDEIILQDTDTWNSPSWLFSDRNSFRYSPTHDLIRRFGLVGYAQIVLTGNHILPCQFMKRYAKTEEEQAEADAFERQKGILACLVSGILPSVYWICFWIMACSNGVKASFVGWVFLSVYFLLAARFGLAHILAQERVVFREYDNWWTPIGVFWPIATFVGIPLLGWTGGFYIGVPGINYLHDKYKTALGQVYLPINMFTLVLFFLHQLARIVSPGVLLWAGGLLDVLGYAAFFCSITDLAMPIVAFPSGAMAIRRWNFLLFVGLWVSWCAVLVCGILLPNENESSGFMDLSVAACVSQ